MALIEIHVHQQTVAGEDKLMAKLDRLIEEVSDLKTVNASAVALLTGLSAALRGANGDQAKIDEIVADLDAQTKALADAVTANTPATTEPPPAPPADQV